VTGPLSDVVVVDLTRNLAGPYATMILGDLGARVIKIERPGSGDDTRHWTPPAWNDQSTVFVSVNRNKESVEADITTPAGVDLVRSLAATADVVIESNRTGSLERYGLGYDDLRALNPRIVYCSLSGFGSKGPDQDRPGYDTIVQAASGVMSINGEPGRNPIRVGPSIVDQGTGVWAALGVIAALRQRDATGEAQHVETSLFEVGVSWMSYFASNFMATGTVPQPNGAKHAQLTPYEGFSTKDDYLFVAALNDRLYGQLCEALGRPSMAADPRFRTNADRVTHRDELVPLIQSVMLERGAADWEVVLRAHGVPCSTVKTIDQVLADKHVEALGLVRDWPNSHIEDFRLIDHPVSYNGTRSFRQDPPPDLGEHTEAVRSELAAAADEGPLSPSDAFDLDLVEPQHAPPP
jgi:crotonobetainyl-CoA:carnitine CoA-transferase CaiB-like acyl-CoA transferase